MFDTAAADVIQLRKNGIDPAAGRVPDGLRHSFQIPFRGKNHAFFLTREALPDQKTGKITDIAIGVSRFAVEGPAIGRASRRAAFEVLSERTVQQERID